MTKHLIKYCLFVAVCAIPFARADQSAAPAASLPLATLRLPEHSAQCATPYQCELITTWTGVVDAYRIWPAIIDPLDWTSARITATDAELNGEEIRVVQRIELVPEKTGTFTLDKIRVPYASKVDLEKSSPDKKPGTDMDIPASVLRVEPVTVEVEASRHLPRGGILWGILGGIIAFGAASVAGGRLLWKRRVQPVQETPRREQIQTFLHDARRRRLDGDYYGYYMALGQAGGLLHAWLGDAAAQALWEKLKNRAQETGYKGERPSDDVLDGDMKDVERALKRWMEQADKTQA